MSMLEPGESHPLGRAIRDARDLVILDQASDVLKSMSLQYIKDDPDRKEILALKKKLRKIAEKHFLRKGEY